MSASITRPTWSLCQTTRIKNSCPRDMKTYFHHSWPWHLIKVSDQLHTPVAIFQGKEPQVPIEYGPQGRPGRCVVEKIFFPSQDLKPGRSARCYTGWAFSVSLGRGILVMMRPAAKYVDLPRILRNPSGFEAGQPCSRATARKLLQSKPSLLWIKSFRPPTL
jgi:hypothetical protein